MIQAKKKQAEMPVSYEWPESFYKEYNSVKRQELLDEHMKQAAAGTEEADAIRIRLLKKRYTTEKQGMKEVSVDRFMRAWMLMRVSALQGVNFFNRRSVTREWKEYADIFGLTDFESKSSSEQELQLLEWEAFFEQVLHLCTTDKTYSSMIFGAFRMSEENLAGKIADELELLTESFPGQLGLEALYARFHEKAAEVYYKM